MKLGPIHKLDPPNVGVNDLITCRSDPSGGEVRKVTKRDLLPYLNQINGSNLQIPFIRDDVLRQIRETLYYLLLDKVVNISLLEQIVGHAANRLAASFIPNNMRVGMLSSEACNQPIMQMTLNTFHAAGSSRNVAQGVTAIENIIKAVQTPRHSGMIICPYNRFTSPEDMILNLRKALAGRTIMNFVSRYSLESTADQRSKERVTSWNQLLEQISHSANPELTEYYRQLVGTKIQKEMNQTLYLTANNSPTYFIRFFLNTDLLYSYQVTPVELAQRINDLVISSGKQVHSKLFFALPTPIQIGVIDIYPNPQNIQIILNATNVVDLSGPEVVMLTSILPATLRNIYVRGIPEINSIFPKRLKVHSIIHKELPDPRGTNNSSSFLIISRRRIQFYGIYLDDLLELLQTLQIRTESISLDDPDNPVYQNSNNTEYLALRVEITSEQQSISSILALEKLLQGTNDRLNNIRIGQAASLSSKSVDPSQQILDQISRDETALLTQKKEALEQLIRIYQSRRTPTPQLIQNIMEIDARLEKKPIKKGDSPEWTKSLTPLGYLKFMIGQDEDDYQKFIRRQRELGLSSWRQPTPIAEAAYRWVLEADGTNINQIYASDFVNPSRSTSSNIYDILYKLGIEAVRNFIISSLLDILTGQRAYFDWRHLTLLTDGMCQTGMVIGISYSNQVNSPNADFFTLATIERVTEVFQRSALFGSKSSTKGVSSAIFAGTHIKGVEASQRAKAVTERTLGFSQKPESGRLEDIGDIQAPQISRDEPIVAETEEPPAKGFEYPLQLLSDKDVAQSDEFLNIFGIQEPTNPSVNPLNPLEVKPTNLPSTQLQLGGIASLAPFVPSSPNQPTLNPIPSPNELIRQNPIGLSNNSDSTSRVRLTPVNLFGNSPTTRQNSSGTIPRGSSVAPTNMIQNSDEFIASSNRPYLTSQIDQIRLRSPNDIIPIERSDAGLPALSDPLFRQIGQNQVQTSDDNVVYSEISNQIVPVLTSFKDFPLFT